MFLEKDSAFTTISKYIFNIGKKNAVKNEHKMTRNAQKCALFEPFFHSYFGLQLSYIACRISDVEFSIAYIVLGIA